MIGTEYAAMLKKYLCNCCRYNMVWGMVIISIGIDEWYSRDEKIHQESPQNET
jgi:hypothetical protein